MMTATKCPTAERLREFSTGRLSEGENDELFEHLRDCETCQAELETLDDTNDSLILDLRQGDEHADFLSEPDCNVALAKALASLAQPAAGADARDTATEIQDFPRTIGEYEIVRPIGRGGMGKVYLARHSKLGRSVAVKVLAGHRLANQRMRDRFDAEMRAIGRLSHPNIVTAHDAREVDGTAVLITEYIDGFDLGEIVNRTGPLSVADASEIVCKVAAALQYISDQGFVHRDVKPSNIMISRLGEVKLLDLGLARYGAGEEMALTGTGQAIGTPDYVSPEQVTEGHRVDSRSDIYSLGCTLFTLLTGNAPFSDAQHQTAFSKMTAHVSEQPPAITDRMADCPSELSQLVAKMLEKEPGRRPESMGRVASSLASWSHGHDLIELVQSASESEAQVRPLPHSTSATPKPWHRRSVPVSTAIATGLMCLAVGLLIGAMMGLYLKITYPDGSEFLFPLKGAKVEVVEADSADAAKQAGQVGNVGEAGGGAKPAVVVPNATPADPTAVPPTATPPTAADRASRAAMAMQETQASLDGIWKLVGIEQGSGDLPNAMLIGFDQGTFYSVLIEDESRQDLAIGPIIGMQSDGSGLTLRLLDQLSGAESTLLMNISEDLVVTTNLGRISSGAKQNKTSQTVVGIIRPVSHRFERIGSFSETAIAQAKLTRQEEILAYSVMMQMKSVGVEQFVQLRMGDEEAQSKSTSKYNLKCLAIAFHNFHDAYRKFPGSVNQLEGSSPRKGKPVQPFSWRVAILPFIEQNELFERYRFDEPWDSENNIKLLDEMPDVFRSPRAPEDQAKGHTNYQGFATGESALGTDGGIGMRELLDGTSNTLLLIETKNTVPWTKPADLTSVADLETFKTVVYALADGSVREADQLDKQLLEKLITRAGREPIPR